jgi:hypothetical protein
MGASAECGANNSVIKQDTEEPQQDSQTEGDQHLLQRFGEVADEFVGGRIEVHVLRAEVPEPFREAIEILQRAHHFRAVPQGVREQFQPQQLLS